MNPVPKSQEIFKPSPLPETTPANFDSKDENIWIGDSGASSHLTNDNTCMYQIQLIHGSVIVANGHKVHIESKGLMDVTFIQRDGSKVDKTIK